jgi:hypothetical protein
MFVDQVCDTGGKTDWLQRRGADKSVFGRYINTEVLSTMTQFVTDVAEKPCECRRPSLLVP